MAFSDREKSAFVEIFIEEGRSYKKFVRRIRHDHGRHAPMPPERTLKDWLARLRETGSAQSRQGRNQPR